jgi:hypothetical protein
LPLPKALPLFSLLAPGLNLTSSCIWNVKQPRRLRTAAEPAEDGLMLAMWSPSTVAQEITADSHSCIPCFDYSCPWDICKSLGAAVVLG